MVLKKGITFYNTSQKSSSFAAVIYNEKSKIQKAFTQLCTA